MTALRQASPARAQSLIESQFKTAREKTQRLGETLVQLGKIDTATANRIESERRKTGGLFGQTAVRMGLITKTELQFALGVLLGILHEKPEPKHIPSDLVMVSKPYSKEAEQIRSLRGHLSTGISEDALSLFALTGAEEGSCAFYMAANLAASFAAIGRRVLVIDANLRRPMLAKILGEPRALGLSDVVAGFVPYEDACSGTMVKNLDLLAAGKAAPDPQAILGTLQFRNLLERARGDYDIVIVLTTPFGTAADCEFVWSSAKRILVVARKDHSRVDDLARIHMAIRRTNSEAIGAAMVV
ncbi:MAG: CpsD/CapB family tyrosine-protein kinase [Pseudomonadota bacterium]